MAIKTALKTGNWSDTTVWPGGVKPTVGDIAQPGVYDVTIDEDITCTRIETNDSGHFLLTTVGGDGTGTRYINADVLNAVYGPQGCIFCTHQAGVMVITGTTATALSSSNNALEAIFNVYAGGIKVIGDIRAGHRNSSNGIFNYRAAPIEVIGDIYGGDGSIGSNDAHGIYNYDNGSITVTGNVYGGDAESNWGILNLVNGTITINGNVIGGTALYAAGIRNDGYNGNYNGNISIIGNVTGGTGTDAYGIWNNTNSPSAQIKGSLINGSGANAVYGPYTLIPTKIARSIVGLNKITSHVGGYDSVTMTTTGTFSIGDKIIVKTNLSSYVYVCGIDFGSVASSTEDQMANIQEGNIQADSDHFTAEYPVNSDMALYPVQPPGATDWIRVEFIWVGSPHATVANGNPIYVGGIKKLKFHVADGCAYMTSTLASGSVSLRCTTSSGKYTVEWWDGSIVEYNSGVTASRTTYNSDPKNIKIYPSIRLSFITDVYCPFAGLTSIDVSGLSRLTGLDCSNNGSLSSIDLSCLEYLTRLTAYNTAIASFDISGTENLLYLSISGTPNCTSIDISRMKKLLLFDCSLSGIASINNLNEASDLIALGCANTNISSLNLSGLQNLSSLDCSGCSNITTLNLDYLYNLTQINCSWCSIVSLTAQDVNLSFYSGSYAGSNISSNQLSASALNAFYTSLGENGGFGIIDVGDNPGIGTDNPTIATDKNYIIINS